MENVSSHGSSAEAIGGSGSLASNASCVASGSNKRPKKGILKPSRSFERTAASSRKTAKFDELNVLQTFHPLNKDYGHMKIEEPKTPYSYGEHDPQREQLDAELLAEKLRIAANTQTSSFGDDEDISDEEFEETLQEKVRRLEFERRRKEHYKEYQAVKLARKLIEEELGDDDEDVNSAANDAGNLEERPSTPSIVASKSSAESPQMEIDQPMENVSSHGSSTEAIGGSGSLASNASGVASGSNKRPKKGILKPSRSFERTAASSRKTAKFDELNVLQTFHPLNKDYGHMKIEEPKTPYSYGEHDPQRKQLDAELLAEKLRIAANTQTSSFGDDEDISDEEFEETLQEKVRRLEFERRRKEHYKEYQAVKLARKLIEEELGDDDEDVNSAANDAGNLEERPSTPSIVAPKSSAESPQMEIDQPMENVSSHGSSTEAIGGSGSLASNASGVASGSNKRPKKGILKPSRSFERTAASSRKTAKFDELNVLQTFHPLNKDYGHMKIEEPKTPYSYGEHDPQRKQLDAELLAEKLRIAANTQTSSFGDDEDISDEEFEETLQEKVRRLEFERRRKEHYKEYQAVKLARKLIEEELGDDDEDVNSAANDAGNLEERPSTPSIVAPKSSAESPQMEIDQPMENVSSHGSSTEAIGGSGSLASNASGVASGSNKRPKKGILKPSRSFERTAASSRKTAKFDELNVLQTFHPLNKDYGHMKIEEPKTPYSYGEHDPQRKQLDAELLAEKLRIAANTQTSSFGDDEDISDEEFEETLQEKVRRLEFERRRKEHYKEYQAVKLARKLIEEELGDDDEDVNSAANDAGNLEERPSTPSIVAPKSSAESPQMEIDQP